MDYLLRILFALVFGVPAALLTAGGCILHNVPRLAATLLVSTVGATLQVFKRSNLSRLFVDLRLVLAIIAFAGGLLGSVLAVVVAVVGMVLWCLWSVFAASETDGVVINKTTVFKGLPTQLEDSDDDDPAAQQQPAVGTAATSPLLHGVEGHHHLHAVVHVVKTVLQHVAQAGEKVEDAIEAEYREVVEAISKRYTGLKRHVRDFGDEVKDAIHKAHKQAKDKISEETEEAQKKLDEVSQAVSTKLDKVAARLTKHHSCLARAFNWVRNVLRILCVQCRAIYWNLVFSANVFDDLTEILCLRVLRLVFNIQHTTGASVYSETSLGLVTVAQASDGVEPTKAVADQVRPPVGFRQKACNVTVTVTFDAKRETHDNYPGLVGDILVTNDDGTVSPVDPKYCDLVFTVHSYVGQPRPVLESEQVLQGTELYGKYMTWLELNNISVQKSVVPENLNNIGILLPKGNVDEAKNIESTELKVVITIYSDDDCDSLHASVDPVKYYITEEEKDKKEHMKEDIMKPREYALDTVSLFGNYMNGRVLAACESMWPGAETLTVFYILWKALVTKTCRHKLVHAILSVGAAPLCMFWFVPWSILYSIFWTLPIVRALVDVVVGRMRKDVKRPLYPLLLLAVCTLGLVVVPVVLYIVLFVVSLLWCVVSAYTRLETLYYYAEDVRAGKTSDAPQSCSSWRKMFLVTSIHSVWDALATVSNWRGVMIDESGGNAMNVLVPLDNSVLPASS